MILLAWLSFLGRGLVRFRFFLFAFSIYLFTLHAHYVTPLNRLWAVALLLGVAALAYAVVPRSGQGRLARRRMVEGALAILLAIDAVEHLLFVYWIPYLAFPVFLFFVYAGYRGRELLLLLGCEIALVLTGAMSPIQDRLTTLGLLALWMLLAVGFRSQEKRKRRGVVDRLNLYEKEASGLSHRSEEYGEILRIDEKKKAHVASMIREREKSFQGLLEILRKALKPHTCALYLFDHNEDLFLLKEVLTDSDRFASRRIQGLEGIFRVIWKEQAPVRLVSKSKPVRGLPYYMGSVDVRSVLAFPLASKDLSLLKGVLVLDRIEPKGFNDDETLTVVQIAEQLVRAIENSEALHAYFHLKEELSAFYAASTALNRSLRVEDVVTTLLDSTQQIVRYDWGVVVLYDKGTHQNRILAEDGEDRKGWEGGTFACAPERGLVSWVVQNQTPLSYKHFRSRQGKTALFPKQYRVPPVYDSVVIFPLQIKRESMGAVLFAARKNHFFSRSVRKMVEVVALQAAASLKNARMVGELERQATTDGLTGLLNHRAFQESLTAEIERSDRHPGSTSLLLIDIDYFKKFNDEYGHPVGDFVLKNIAQVLGKMVRKVDVVARYGGEEFAIILVQTASRGAIQMAKRIVTEVAKSRFVQEGLSLRVTLSVGVATFPDDADNREDLIENADRALYAAKGRGRNQAVVYEPSLDKVQPVEKETRLVEAVEDELRRTASLSSS